MSEQKLRALLAEARIHVAGLAADEVPTRTARALRQDIDAALAEPVGTVIDCPSFLIKTERERDEARAEVEGLRGTWKWDAIKAYKRGAEAMREAAALCVLDSARFWSAQYVADDIRALPIPEDEP